MKKEVVMRTTVRIEVVMIVKKKKKKNRYFLMMSYLVTEQSRGRTKSPFVFHKLPAKVNVRTGAAPDNTPPLP